MNILDLLSQVTAVIILDLALTWIKDGIKSSKKGKITAYFMKKEKKKIYLCQSNKCNLFKAFLPIWVNNQWSIHISVQSLYLPIRECHRLTRLRMMPTFGSISFKSRAIKRINQTLKYIVPKIFECLYWEILSSSNWQHQ